ncbi:protein LAZY 1-like [Cornus florida]|uniref:protein LAZY 1-like n=1 Tax=Cornus florida TaxID=4283 RepID=UPI00289D6DDE|nr:protein LAZY 1-like [Cornus florida]
MRLLCSTHRKLKQNSNEPLKDFPFSQPLLDDQQYHQKSNYGTRPLHKAQRDNHRGKSFTSLEAVRVEEEDYEEEESAAISELFHGFLPIGTLGSDTVITDPPTPTFPILDNITKKESGVTVDELKLINCELETVLEVEGKEDGFNESSGRNSHVSTGRSSHAKTITLGGKPNKITETNGSGTIICSLQGCVSGSANELPEITVAKKEHRVSLGELFQRTSTEDNFSGAKSERGEKRTEKETGKSAVHFMKKMQKRRMFPASSRISSVAATGGNADSNSTETKLHKILHMFRRKVHPESSTGIQNYEMSKKEITYNFNYEEGCANGDQFSPDEDIIIIPHRAISKVSIRCFKSQSNPPQVTLSGSDSNGNRECWINTDADYNNNSSQCGHYDFEFGCRFGLDFGAHFKREICLDNGGFIMTSPFSPLAKHTKRNRLTGPNYIDWKRLLDIVLTYEGFNYVFPTPRPSPPLLEDPLEEHEVFKEWNKVDEMTRCYILASLLNLLKSHA